MAVAPFHQHDKASQSLLLGLNVPTKQMEVVPFDEVERCATENDMQELRGKYDGQVESVLDAINEGTPFNRTSFTKLRIKKHTARQVGKEATLRQ